VQVTREVRTALRRYFGDRAHLLRDVPDLAVLQGSEVRAFAHDGSLWHLEQHHEVLADAGGLNPVLAQTRQTAAAAGVLHVSIGDEEEEEEEGEANQYSADSAQQHGLGGVTKEEGGSLSAQAVWAAAAALVTTELELELGNVSQKTGGKAANAADLRTSSFHTLRRGVREHIRSSLAPSDESSSGKAPSSCSATLDCSANMYTLLSLLQIVRRLFYEAQVICILCCIVS
jgi:hypothetical protein